MPEHKYVLDLITMGQSLCKSFLKQGVLTKHQSTINELILLQDALPSMVLLNGCTAHIDGDPNCPQLKLKANGKSLNAVLDTGAKVSLINKQLFDQIPHKCKTALCPSILQLVAANVRFGIWICQLIIIYCLRGIVDFYSTSHLLHGLCRQVRIFIRRCF